MRAGERAAKAARPAGCMRPAAVNRATWATRATLREIFDYAFNFLGLARVSGFIASGNAAALKAALDIGFVVEGEIREAAPGDDALVMIGMLRRECRWIRQGTGHG